MKKYIILGSSLLLLVVLMIFLFCCYFMVYIPKGEVTAVFKYADADINKPLSDEDSEIVRKIFNAKIMLPESPSCGFTEDVALIINGNTYCIACDNCGIIYSVEKDMYFDLNDKENELLRRLLSEYGFRFPCV